jgi:cyanophycin synthetase
VKPEKGRGGDCVAVGLRTLEEFDEAFERAGKKWKRVIVEESLAGVGVRMIYVAPEVISARLSLPPGVTGDGKRTLQALIEAENRRRDEDPLGLEVILVDDTLLAAMRRRGLSMNDVPALGHRVVLTDVANCMLGAGFIVCGNELHPSYKRVVEQACRSIPGLELAGVDLQILDIGQPAAPGNHWVLELNAAPGFDSFHAPVAGKPVDVAGAIVDMLRRRG